MLQRGIKLNKDERVMDLPAPEELSLPFFYVCLTLNAIYKFDSDSSSDSKSNNKNG